MHSRDPAADFRTIEQSMLRLLELTVLPPTWQTVQLVLQLYWLWLPNCLILIYQYFLFCHVTKFFWFLFITSFQYHHAQNTFSTNFFRFLQQSKLYTAWTCAKNCLQTRKIVNKSSAKFAASNFLVYGIVSLKSGSKILNTLVLNFFWSDPNSSPIVFTGSSAVLQTIS